MVNLSCEEKKVLEPLFIALFLNDFGHTLVGAKPLSIETIVGSSIKIGNFFTLLQKVFHNYSSQNYAIKIDRFCKTRLDITFIHKPLFKEVFEKNRTLFSKVFGSSITAKHVLDLVISSSSNTHVFHVLQEKQELMGILLGYGTENSLLFSHAVEIDKAYNQKNIFSRAILENRISPEVIAYAVKNIPKNSAPYKYKKFCLSKGCRTLDEEAQVIENTLKDFCEPPTTASLAYIIVPQFRAKESLETANLRRKYSKSKEQIAKLYFEKDILDATLEYLFSN